MYFSVLIIFQHTYVCTVCSTVQYNTEQKKAQAVMMNGEEDVFHLSQCFTMSTSLFNWFS